jgi:hypothetical protein
MKRVLQRPNDRASGRAKERVLAFCSKTENIDNPFRWYSIRTVGVVTWSAFRVSMKLVINGCFRAGRMYTKQRHH